MAIDKELEAEQIEQARKDEIAQAEADVFTGQLPQQVEELAYKRDVTSLFAQNEAFQQMKATKGWRLLEKFIDSQIDWLLQQLRIEVEHSRIIRLQAEILAFESLVKIIDLSFVNSEQAKKHLLDMVSREDDLGN